MKRNNFKNLVILLLSVLALYLLDNTRLNKYIGYEKVKIEIHKDINVFGLGKTFFGEGVLNFFNIETTVSSSVTSEVKSGNGYIVFQYDERLYSTFLGTVIKISKNRNLYSVVIGMAEQKILIGNIKILNVKLYQKIEVDTLIGYIDGYYYYEKI